MVHQAFMQYLEYYDEEVRQEWLDDEKRAEHLKNIDEFSELKELELSKQFLLYFTIYKNRDKLKEEIFDDTKEEIKSAIIEEIVPEAISAFIPGAKIAYKVARLVYKNSIDNKTTI